MFAFSNIWGRSCHFSPSFLMSERSCSQCEGLLGEMSLQHASHFYRHVFKGIPPIYWDLGTSGGATETINCATMIKDSNPR